LDFRRKFIEKLEEEFKKELFLVDLFDEFYNRLKEFKRELNRYISSGCIEVVFEEDDDLLVLKISDDFVRFELISDIEPYIEVTADDVIYEESNPKVIDKIKSFDDGYSIYWNSGMDKAFDYYLEKAFEDVL
jgi:hypothetical protein